MLVRASGDLPRSFSMPRLGRCPRPDPFWPASQVSSRLSAWRSSALHRC